MVQMSTLQNSCTVPSYKWKKKQQWFVNPYFSLFIKSEINYKISVHLVIYKKKAKKNNK